MTDLTAALFEPLRPILRDEIAAVVAEVIEATPRTFSTGEVAVILGVGKETVHQMLDAGQLWKVPLPTSTVRIPRQAVDALMARPALRVVDSDKGAA